LLKDLILSFFFGNFAQALQSDSLAKTSFQQIPFAKLERKQSSTPAIIKLNVTLVLRFTVLGSPDCAQRGGGFARAGVSERFGRERRVLSGTQCRTRCTPACVKPLVIGWAFIYSFHCHTVILRIAISQYLIDNLFDEVN
jgi:hypothetical protein